ncbi:hypothetical protein MJO29_000945 [Puccinia striiformis f. sp. tritici]|uniref:hypothetical protein n=1 Tax=Puccinia striiformis f. sp. tritici TaxID=168172 RepID=UPI0020076640|nr:hypothetical protein Pst134EA_000945 [Puccinia striiformis f. sp. tritici]KAH9473883.1 hypothetical protein Pst134EA_000945 [Puccinia striiformis f. sp. tritici]KAI7967668.1 hypothetical protein MJO29_000945 [Puccinia striiformis f. sp. tritici]KAI9602228.1 hypothetical protein KEM48_000798 [Puccinia striiformis f. sp. tritici PST-130]
MFFIRKKTKNTSVSATIVSTSPPPATRMNSPPPTTKSSNRFSRSNQQIPTAMASPSTPEVTCHQPNPDDTLSYQSFTYSPSQQPHSPTAISPGGALSHTARAGLRKSRQMPTFNLMVLGAKSTGKSTFLHTLIGSLTPSLPTQNDQPSMPVPSTLSLSDRLTSIVTLSGEKVMFNVIDTPGLDIRSNDQFRVDLQMNESLRYIESKFDDSLQIERQVHRNPTRLGDGHVHVAVYFIDPSTVTRQVELLSSAENHVDSTASKPHHGHELHMSSLDLRQMKRLSRRCNILPVIGRADELTEAELINIKNVVQSDMKSYGIDLGLFAVIESESDQDGTSSDHPEVTTDSSNSGKSNEEEDTRKKLPRRKSTALLTPRRPVSSIMDNSHELDGVCGMIPLSVIGAEVMPGKSMDADDLERLNQLNPLFKMPNTEDSPSIYVRRFKWATVDVLNPRHCDFVLLRAVILGSHFKRLKEATRLEKYEKYRTEKLLARRMTMNKGPVGIEEQRQIAMEIEKMEIPHIEPAVSIFIPSRATTRSPSASGNIFKPSGWRKKQSSPPSAHQQQPSAYPSPTNTETYRSSRLPSRSPHPENVNNLPMVF